jgi:two-component system chemotaxis sensor kinase CheA
MAPEIDSEHQEFVQEFVQEVRELLEGLEPDILTMEQVCLGDDIDENEKKELINSIFRLFHSIKGAAGFLKFDHIQATAHSAENLLDKIRTGELTLIPNHVDLFCMGCDFLKAALDHVDEFFEDETLEEQALQAKVELDAALAQDIPSPSPSPTMDIDLDAPPPAEPDADMIARFVGECAEIISGIESDLAICAEKGGDTESSVANLFRGLHTIKSNCSFMGYVDLEQLCHRMEVVTEALRDGDCLSSDAVPDSLLTFVDMVKDAINNVGRGESDTIDGLDIYLDMLTDFLPIERRNFAETKKSEPELLGDILVAQGVAQKEDIEKARAIQQKPIGEILVETGAVSEKQVQVALAKQSKVKKKKSKKAKGAVTQQDIRVNLGKLDSLIDLIGEMVIAENMLINSPDLEGLELENFTKASQHMTKLVRDLQEMAMTIRMIPVAGLFRRMIRLVHDLSRKSGKQVDLQLSGEETEVDKTVIEIITDPLVHILRNSMDHGLESVAERQASNKADTGVVRLSAAHEEGSIVISIADDGRGLNKEKIRDKAVENGLYSREEATALSDTEIYQLIFAPGFSTAEKVTDISGRGVGMDVVRQNLKKIRGEVEVESTSGVGSTITLRIPLTLAIIEGMMVRTGTSKYILPILAIRESFQPTSAMITISPDGQEVVKVRSRLMPVYRLHALHRVTPDSTKLEEGILIVLDAGQRVCLFVDEILGQQQTVIKGLSKYISKHGNVGGVSGCTILGNGEVCLILDVQKIVDLARVDQGYGGEDTAVSKPETTLEEAG